MAAEVKKASFLKHMEQRANGSPRRRGPEDESAFEQNPKETGSVLNVGGRPFGEALGKMPRPRIGELRK